MSTLITRRSLSSQIIKYLTFLRSKKDSILRSMRNDFEDARTGLSEDVYSKSDVADFTDFLESQTNVRSHYRAVLTLPLPELCSD
jgi:hypothetical protein